MIDLHRQPLFVGEKTGCGEALKLEGQLLRINQRLLSLIRNHLWAKVLLGLLLGALTGTLIGPSVGWVEAETARQVAEWIAVPGVIFIRLIKLIIIPLVVSSIMLGLLSSDDLDQLKRLGLRVVGYFIFTTAVAIQFGLLMAHLFEPGRFFKLPDSLTLADAPPPKALDGSSLPQFITNLVPDNLLAALVQAEMLGVIVASVLFGIAIFSLSEQYSKPVTRLLGATQEISMTVVGWSMRLAPFAVFGLVCQLTAQTGLEVLRSIALYMFTVIAGLVLLLLFYLVLVWFLARRNLFRFLQRISEVQLLAFSTASSAATMPLTLIVAEEKLGLRRSLVQFIVPIGATVNMDGTALYQGVATVFLAQAFQIELTIPALALMVVTVVLASIGTPATPMQASLCWLLCCSRWAFRRRVSP